jgi:hypothetical protein
LCLIGIFIVSRWTATIWGWGSDSSTNGTCVSTIGTRFTSVTTDWTISLSVNIIISIITVTRWELVSVSRTGSTDIGRCTINTFIRTWVTDFFGFEVSG